MERIMLRRVLLGALGTGLAAVLASCGGGGSASNTTPPPPQTAALQLMVSDAASDDWATIGVQLMSVALIPQGGGSNVTIWTASTTPAPLNLVQLDNLSDIIGSVGVPVNTYSGAVITVSGNPGDVVLTVASNPESGFPVHVEKTMKGTGMVKEFTYFGLHQRQGTWYASQVEAKIRGHSGSTLLIIDRGSAKAHLDVKEFNSAQLTHF